MDVAILLFDRFTALDVAGPADVLSRLPGATLHFVAADPGLKVNDTGALRLEAGGSLDEVRSPDVVFVPGGPGAMLVMNDDRILEWLRAAHEASQWTTSVCTGSILLGAAGILDGRRATSHWLAIDALEQFGAQVERARVVEDGKLITAAGVSAGIDMALTLAARIAGDERAKAAQLGVEYDPQPPFDCGSPAKAPADVVEQARAIELAIVTERSVD